MPCRSDYMEPTRQEQAYQHSAKMLCTLLTIQQANPSTELRAAANNSYCDVDFAPELCQRLRELTPQVRDSILYGRPKDRARRELATWWEDHVIADEAREQTERKTLRYRINRAIGGEGDVDIDLLISLLQEAKKYLPS